MKFSQGFNFKKQGLFQKSSIVPDDDYSEYEYINLPTQLAFLRGLYFEDFFGELLVERLPCNVLSQLILRDYELGINGTPDFVLTFKENADIEDLILDFCLGLNVFKKKKRDSGLMHVSGLLQGEHLEDFWKREAEKSHVSKKEVKEDVVIDKELYQGKTTILELKTMQAKSYQALKSPVKNNVLQLVYYRYLLGRLQEKIETKHKVKLGELSNDLYLVYLCDQKSKEVQNSAKYFKINYLKYVDEIQERVNRNKEMKEKYIK